VDVASVRVDGDPVDFTAGIDLAGSFQKERGVSGDQVVEIDEFSDVSAEWESGVSSERGWKKLHLHTATGRIGKEEIA